MDTVLGLSMTPTTVGLVLVEGDGADGATKNHDAFEVRRGGYSPVTTSEFVAEALSRTQAIAGGQHLQSIGVTWSDDAAVEASMFLDSLADSGFHNVVPIRLPEATEAFARGIGEVIESRVTAVCVVEPDAVVALVVDTVTDATDSVVSYDLESESDLIGWLADVLARDGWQPDSLVVLGSGEELDQIARELEQVLGIPVFAPAEAELALARGAALASVNSIGLFDDPLFVAPPRPPRRRPLSHSAPVAMVVGGVLTFVVSASVAVGLAVLPDGDSANAARAFVTSAETPAVRPVTAPLAPVPPPQLAPPAPEQAPIPAPPPDVAPAPAPEAALTEESVSDAPAPAPVEAPPSAAPVEAMAPPPEAIQPTVPPVPTSKPSLRTRILERLSGLRDGNG
ncbi:hypothetical protein [Mycobacterium sp. DL592]|uniref:DUF7159 family protein n=1 Tax=Mycobacterium sp. DL592 TaxID=2675524 RepID=UPI0014228490|nr:hypothetical protein [Mycobacterium sp. DL592]